MAGLLLPRPGCLFLLSLLLSLAIVSRAQDCDQRCATNNCDSDGVCICDLPSNSSILQGDRPFLGGQFCDTPRTMCDGTNKFWCENGICNEIIQGENYTCVCKDGFSGDHCELEGKQCGGIFCYHNGQCNEAKGSCDCPASWRGSIDCSTPTTKNPEPNTSGEPDEGEAEDDDDSWFIPVLVVILVLVVPVVVICVVKTMRKRSMAATEFHKLRQVQMRGFIDEDEEAFSHAPLSKAELA